MEKFEILPNFFRKGHIPKKLNPKLQRLIDIRLKTAKNKEDCLKKAYAIITKKYHGSRELTYPLLYRLITVDPNKLWEQSGFIHCTNFAYLIRILLIKSGFFTEDEIKLKWTTAMIWSPHQYLQVKLSENKFVNVDAWGHAYGVPLGKYVHGFDWLDTNDLLIVKTMKGMASAVMSLIRI